MFGLGNEDFEARVEGSGLRSCGWGIWVLKSRIRWLDLGNKGCDVRVGRFRLRGRGLGRVGRMRPKGLSPLVSVRTDWD